MPSAAAPAHPVKRQPYEMPVQWNTKYNSSGWNLFHRGAAGVSAAPYVHNLKPDALYRAPCVVRLSPLNQSKKTNFEPFSSSSWALKPDTCVGGVTANRFARSPQIRQLISQYFPFPYEISLTSWIVLPSVILWNLCFYRHYRKRVQWRKYLLLKETRKITIMSSGNQKLRKKGWALSSSWESNAFLYRDMIVYLQLFGKSL